MDTPGTKFTCRFGGFALDPASRTLSRDGEALALAPKEFQTLTLPLRPMARPLPA